MPNTKIPYATKCWNPVVGCEGCSIPHCWARELHNMRHAAYKAGKKMPVMYARPYEEVQFFPERLKEPLSWRDPQIVFVGSQTDLFGPDVTFGELDRIFAVTALTPQHKYLILSKRIDRKLEYFQTRTSIDDSYRFDRMPQWYQVVTDWLDEGVAGRLGKKWDACESAAEKTNYLKPLTNVWLGASITNQEDANRIIPQLLQIPASHRWLSIEPTVGPIDINQDYFEGKFWGDMIFYVVIGCESGPDRRPCKIEWMLDLVKQCKAAGIKCFVKQVSINGKASRNMSEWPEELQVQERI